MLCVSLKPHMISIKKKKQKKKPNTEHRMLHVQPLTSNVKQNQSAANPEAPLSSDHSNSAHLFCQTLSRQYRTNNCYIIPITQWQCVCFVSLNYFRYITFFFCPLGKKKTRTSGGIEMHIEKTAALQRDMNSPDLPLCGSSPQT